MRVRRRGAEGATNYEIQRKDDCAGSIVFPERGIPNSWFSRNNQKQAPEWAPQACQDQCEYRRIAAGEVSLFRSSTYYYFYI